MTTISEDLLQELLLLLPSTDLLRFRCVSKSWRDLIDSPNFIQLHLNKSLKNMNSREEALAVADCIHPDYDAKFLFYAISIDSKFRFAVTREIDPPLQNISGLVYIGSCRSLICLKITVLDDDYHKIVLWNPSTHSHRVLPFSPVGIEGRWYDFRYAFGYDEVADDYKVARLTFIHLKYNKNDYEAKIYSLNLDSWKEIDKVPLVFLAMSRPIHAKGVIIWVFGGWGERAFSLLILPLRTQVLQLVSFRDDLYKFDFEFKHCSSCPYQISSCDCDCQYRTLLKLINNKQSDTLTNFFLPDSNVDEGMDFLNNSFHEKLCSELRSLEEKLHSKTIGMYSDCTCCWVDSLVRVERSIDKSKMRKAHPLVETEAQGNDYKRQR